MRLGARLWFGMGSDVGWSSHSHRGAGELGCCRSRYDWPALNCSKGYLGWGGHALGEVM